jgi:hypothetical protein
LHSQSGDLTILKDDLMGEVCMVQKKNKKNKKTEKTMLARLFHAKKLKTKLAGNKKTRTAPHLHS